MKFFFCVVIFCLGVDFTSAQGPQQMFWALNKNNFLLDIIPDFTPSAAYSVRKLRKGYTGFAMRVRKQVPGADPQGDVAFDNKGFVSDSSRITITTAGGGYSVGNVVLFKTFYGTSDVYVRTWYDQSIAGNHATQTASSSQPMIVNSGTLITENSRLSLEFTDDHGSMNLPLGTPINLANGTLFGICKAVTPGTTSGIADNGTYSYNVNTFNNTGKIGVTHYTVLDVPSTVSHSAVLDAISWAKSSASSSVEINTRSVSGASAINIPIGVSQIYGNALTGSVMRISEFIVGSYTSTATRSVVFSNQKLVFNTP